MVRLVKLLVAIALLPTLVLAGGEFILLFKCALGQWKNLALFLGGAAAYGIIHYAWYDFSRFYVFGHEMTHALAAFVCGYKVHKISVKKDSGFVKMDKTNAFVVLAPYFIPFYTLVFAFIYWVGGLFTDLAPYGAYLLAAVGFLTSFHLIQTFKTLWETDQPDLKLAGGKVFSLVTIMLVNLALLACVFKILFPQEVHLTQAALHVLQGSLNIWRIIVNYIVEQTINAV